VHDAPATTTGQLGLTLAPRLAVPEGRPGLDWNSQPMPDVRVGPAQPRRR
jgi:hypothetical protein